MNPASARTGALQRLNLPGLKVPRPLMPAETESRLTPRQRQVLDSLETLVVQEELAEMTMAQIAAKVNCSLRTLYGISPSKDELVMTIMDRRLHRIGRSAIESLDPKDPPLVNLERYLTAANEAVESTAGAFVRGYFKLPGARRVANSHEVYVVAVVKSLLDRARAEGYIADVDTAAVAHVLGGLGRDFARSEVASLLMKSPGETANTLTAVILRGLPRD